MYSYFIEKSLKRKLSKLAKKDKPMFDTILKKIEEIVQRPEHYKPLRYDLKNIKRVHIKGSFVLVFRFERNEIRFMDFDHHDNIYKKKF